MTPTLCLTKRVKLRSLWEVRLLRHFTGGVSDPPISTVCGCFLSLFPFYIWCMSFEEIVSHGITSTHPCCHFFLPDAQRHFLLSFGFMCHTFTERAHWQDTSPRSDISERREQMLNIEQLEQNTNHFQDYTRWTKAHVWQISQFLERFKTWRWLMGG